MPTNKPVKGYSVTKVFTLMHESVHFCFGMADCLFISI